MPVSNPTQMPSLKQVTINILTFFFWNVSQNICTLLRLLFSTGILLNRYPLQRKSSNLLRLAGTHFSVPLLAETQMAEDCKRVFLRAVKFPARKCQAILPLFIWFWQQMHMYLFNEQLMLLLLIYRLLILACCWFQPILKMFS